MEQKKKEQQKGSTWDEKEEPPRFGEVQKGSAGDRGTQVHADERNDGSRRKNQIAGDRAPEELTPAGRGVRADRAGRDALAGVDDSTPRDNEETSSDEPKEESSAEARRRKAEPNPVPPVAEDNE